MKILPLALLLVASAPALAQTSALKGLDTGAPIDVDAARIEIQDQSNQGIFTGNVVIRQGRMTLNADTVKVSYTRVGDGLEMQRLDARGKVKLVSPSETATASSAVYDVGAKLVTMIGNVVLDRNGSVLRGQRLVLDLASGRTSFDARNSSGTGRVTGRFLVPAKKP